jgi:c-di-GMP-binding flagellar brake protein YcgR
MNRRAYQRYKTELTAIVQRLSHNGQPTAEAMKGKIVDISSGGVGICVKNLKIGEAACLHNSHILVSATYSLYGLNHELKKIGTVVSLKFHPRGECSVHVQFEEPMDDDRVMAIAQHADVIAYI